MLECKGSAQFSVASVATESPEFYVEGTAESTIPAQRPAAAAFQRRHAGGGGGAGGGRGGLGSRHAAKAAADVLPNRMAGVSDQAARYVATKPRRFERPKSGAFEERAQPPTTFRLLYERGDLPLRVNGGVQKFVQWHLGPSFKPSAKAAPNFSAAGGPEYEEAKARFLAALDYSVYLPLFFDGLREKTEPCRFLAARGLADLLENAHAGKVAPIVPRLVLPIRLALNTREPAIVRRTIVALRQLAEVHDEPAWIEV